MFLVKKTLKSTAGLLALFAFVLGGVFTACSSDSGSSGGTNAVTSVSIESSVEAGEDGSVTIDASGTVELTAKAVVEGSPTIEYSWALDDKDADYAELSATTGSPVTLTGKNTTEEDVTVTVTVIANDGKNSKTATLSVVVKAKEEEEDGITSVSITTADGATSASIQYDGTVSLKAVPVTTGTVDLSYAWKITGGSDYASLSESSTDTVTLTANNTTTTEQTVTVKVTATDKTKSELTATSSVFSVTLSAYGETVENKVTSVSITTDADSISTVGSTTLTANPVTTGSPSITYVWAFADDESSYYGTLSNSTANTVTLTGKNTTNVSQNVNVIVTAKYTDSNDEEKSVVSESVSVVVAAKTLTKIEADTTSTKTSYTVGDDFSSTEIVVTATYSDGTTSDVSWSVEYSGYNLSAAVTEATTQTVTITYTDDFGTKTTTYTITVSPVASDAEVADFTWNFSASDGVTMYSDEACTTADDDSTIQYSNSSVTAYLKGSSSDSSVDAVMKIETPVSGSKIAIRSTNGDVQVNTGSLFYIPVSSGSVVTVTQKTSSTGYELGGEESLTYTSSSAGYVLYEVLSSHYLSSIAVTNVKSSDTHTSDVVSFTSTTDSSTANTTAVLGFTAASVESTDTSVATVDLTSKSGYITVTSKAAGTTTIKAIGSGDETTSWTVTVRRYGNIVVGGITPYSSAAEVTSVWLKTSSGGDVTVKGGQVTTSAGSFVYLNKEFAAGTKVRIEATTSSYTSGTKTLDVGFINNPANVATENGIYTTAGGANSGKAVGNSSNGWQGDLTGSSPYKYVTEYTFSSSTATTSSHYIYDSESDTSSNTTYCYKTGVTPSNSTILSSGYAIFGDTTNEVVFTLIEVYEVTESGDTLVYSSAESETGEITSSSTLTFLNGDTDLKVGYTESSGTYTFTATAPDSSDSYTYKWYVDLVEQDSTSSSCSVTLSSGIYAILVTVTEASTDVVYSAQYTLSVE